ncbi:MAG: Threonylcarbamoyl-AMP synthase [Promethearchaeota archaeon]|nr:MAG: Threonylcarbamoyl-AMP synthase [Candidatus Lokiarchaeota archaeon]
MGFLVTLKDEEDKDKEVFLEIAADYIIDGKLIAFPTNSVYALGGDPQNSSLFKRVCRIKFRGPEEGFILLVSDIYEAKKVGMFNETAEKLANKYWPGELTLVIEKKQPNIIPDEVTGSKEKIGLRVPENETILRILEILKEKGHFGGIIGTSANYSGEDPSTSGKEVARTFLGPIDLIIDGEESISKMPTTIVDCTTQKPEFLRIGKIPEDEILSYLKNQ